MGVDVLIFAKVKSGPELDFHFPSDYEFREIQSYRKEDVPEATHEVDTLSRYYGEGYERGHWPTICSVLMELISSDAIEKVWYGGDSSTPGEITKYDVARLSIHYMTHETSPYHEREHKFGDNPNSNDCINSLGVAADAANDQGDESLDGLLRYIAEIKMPL